MVVIAPSTVLADVNCCVENAFDPLPCVWVVQRRKQTGLCRNGVRLSVRLTWFLGQRCSVGLGLKLATFETHWPLWELEGDPP